MVCLQILDSGPVKDLLPHLWIFLLYIFIHCVAKIKTILECGVAAFGQVMFWAGSV